MQTSVVLALFHLLLVGGFTITTEYPASASSPTNKQYVSVVLSSERGRSRLPAGSYLRLVGGKAPGGPAPPLHACARGAAAIEDPNIIDACTAQRYNSLL